MDSVWEVLNRRVASSYHLISCCNSVAQRSAACGVAASALKFHPRRAGEAEPRQMR